MLIRTVLGDIPASRLGACSAHEHVVIDAPHIARDHPQLHLADVDRITVELRAFHDAGGRAVIDTMPGECGRHAAKLVTVSRASGVHVVAATGLHLPRYYPTPSAMLQLDEQGLFERFVEEITTGMDGQPCRAGVVKVAGGKDRLTDAQRAAFRAAAAAQRATGCPIITHTEGGTAAMEQATLLANHGADLRHVVLSHTDRNPDTHHHRDLLQTGVRLEYDAAFRWADRSPNPTVDLIARLAPQFPDQLMVGMDLAKPAYWRSFGGSPGLAWLITDLPALLRDAGLEQPLIDRLLVHNPAQAFSFITQERSSTRDEPHDSRLTSISP